MTPKRLLGLALVAVIGYALLTTERPAPPEPTTACNEANDVFNKGLYGTALDMYRQLLQEGPSLSCALEGVAAVGQLRCAQARQLQSEGRDETAAKLLEETLLDDPGKSCLLSVRDPGNRPIGHESESNLAGWAQTRIDDLTNIWKRETPPWLDRFGSWLTRQLGPLEVFLIAFLGLALIVHLLRLARLRRTPIVEVGELANATGDDELDKSTAGLAALLRVRLSAAGISPPAIPGGNVQESAIAAIEASPLPQGTFIAPFIKFVLDQMSPSAGHKVSGTLQKREDGKCGVTLLLTDVYEGRTDTIVSAWRDDHEEAIEISAAQVYKRVIAELPKEAAIPAWRRWTGSGDSMRFFYRAKDSEEVGDLEGALEDYAAAERADPANALPALQRAYILTEQGHHVSALQIYLDIVLFWPALLQARDRLAATYSFVHEWIGEWGKLAEDEVQKLRGAIRTVENQSVPDHLTENWFLDRGLDQYGKTLELIDKEIKDASRQRLWIMRPVYRRFLGWVRLYPSKLKSIRELRQRRMTTVIAKICTDLQRHPTSFREREMELRKEFGGRFPLVTGRFRRWKVGWQAQYNAACFFSRAFDAGNEQTWHARPILEEALDHLAKAMDDPLSQLSAGWLCEDPDLGALREDQRGAFLREHCEDSTPSHERSSKMVRRLRLAWVLLAKGADRRQGDWTTRKTDVTKWTGVQGRDLEMWCQGEKDAWGRLVHWAERPEDEGRQNEFWKTVLKSDEEQELPELELPQNGLEGTQEEHQAAWLALARCAATQRDRWDGLEDAIREANMSGASSLDQLSASTLAEAAQERWLALKDWAEGPLDEGPQSYFKLKARCDDSDDLLVRLIQLFFGDEP